MKRDYATTFIAEALVVASYLLAFRIVAAQLGTAGFGEYAVARRTLAVLVPLGALSLDVALARYVAYAVTEGSDRARRYIPAGISLVLGSTAVLAAVMLLFPGPLAAFFFGSPTYAPLILPMPLLLLGGGLHGVAFGSLRGRSQIQRANVLMVLNQAVVPLIAIALSGGSVAGILYLMGAGWALVSIAFIAIAPISLSDMRPRLIELARYGIPRLPGDLLRLSLFALPSLVVAHLADITTAGGVAFGVATVGMLGTALSPIGFVLLPAAARMMATGSISELRRQVLQIARFTAFALSAAIVIVEVFAPQMVSLYLGAKFVAMVDSLRVIAPAALPWGIYMSLGSVIDAHHVRPMNARNIAIAFAVYVVAAAGLVLIGAPALSIAAAFVVSMYVLGALTLLEVNRITSRRDAVAPLTPESQPLL